MSYSVLDNARIIIGDGVNVIEKGVLVLEHRQDFDSNKIIHVGESGSWKDNNAEQTTVDLQGYTLLPGLFNCHNHLDLTLPYLPYRVDKFGPAYRSLVSYRRAAEALRCGVTTIRCVGMASGCDLAVKKAIAKKMLWGSRLVVAGEILIADGGHGWNDVASRQCSGADEFRRAARQQISAGADFIKIGLTGGLATPNEGVQDKQMANDEIAAVVEVAQGANKRVAAHLGSDRAIRQAVDLGVSSVEHAYDLSRETAELLAAKNVFLVPTLCVSTAKDYLIAHGSPQYHVDKLAAAADHHRQSIKHAIAAGVRLALGSDLLASDPLAGTVAVIRELELLVDVGLTPLQAIAAASSNAAELCGISEFTGQLIPGMAGDLIAVAGNPDKDISQMRRLALVAKEGRLVWSTVPGYQRDNFKILPPDCTLGGGTFAKW